MNNPVPLPRRSFLSHLAVLAAGCALREVSLAQESAPAVRRFPIVVFSKVFQKLGPEETADLVATVGWNGIECPVRKGGQIEPERVEDDLPRWVEALQKRQCRVEIITTDVRSRQDPFAERILRTAARLGIKHYRMGWAKYRRDRPIPDQLRELQGALKDLAVLNQELGLCAGFQNHSGSDYVGAPVWDIFELIRDLDPRHLGVHFDIGHATVEGGYAWPTHAQLMEKHLSAVYVKDFTWQKTGNRWQAAWCPLGQGMISRAFFDWLKKTRFSGPISQHHEYDLGDRTAQLKAFKQDLATLKEWLGYQRD